MDTYEYENGTLLECPIYSLGGSKDAQQRMGSWAMESLSKKSENVLFPGGSFFLLDPDTEVSAAGSHIYVRIIHDTVRTRLLSKT